jgi:hypothetical protein
MVLALLFTLENGVDLRVALLEVGTEKIRLRSKCPGGNAAGQRWLCAKALLPKEPQVHHDVYDEGYLCMN